MIDAPDPAGTVHVSAPPDHLAALEGPTCKKKSTRGKWDKKQRKRKREVEQERGKCEGGGKTKP